MKEYQYTFIDLDGPILDGQDRNYVCYKTIVERYGGRLIEQKQYWTMKRNRVSLGEILKVTQFQGTEEEYKKEFGEIIESLSLLRMDKIQYKAEESIIRLREHSDKVVLLTLRKNRKNLYEQLNEFKLLGYFDKVIACKYGDEMAKYREVQRYSFEKAIMIGDTEADMKVAQIEGVRFIGIMNGLRSEEYFKGVEAYQAIDQICI